jgi:hypothetical protein
VLNNLQCLLRKLFVTHGIFPAMGNTKTVTIGFPV